MKYIYKDKISHMPISYLLNLAKEVWLAYETTRYR